MSLPDSGTPFHIDACIFHRTGLDRAHHVEEGIEVFCEPAGLNPEEGSDERTLLLTQRQRDDLRASYVALLDGLLVPADDPTAHPQVKAVHPPE